jgi:hypothetical protein
MAIPQIDTQRKLKQIPGQAFLGAKPQELEGDLMLDCLLGNDAVLHLKRLPIRIALIIVEKQGLSPRR